MSRPVTILACIACVSVGGALVLLVRTPRVPSPRALATVHEARAEQGDAPVKALTPAQADARLAELDRAIAARPRDPVPREARMHVAVTHRPQIAESMARVLLKRDEDSVYALTHLAAALSAQGHLKHALHYAARAVKREASPANRHLLADLLDADGRSGPAAEQRRLAATAADD